MKVTSSFIPFKFIEEYCCFDKKFKVDLLMPLDGNLVSRITLSHLCLTCEYLFREMCT